MRFGLWMIVLLAASTAFAESPTDQELKIAVDLADGSHLIGTPSTRSLPMNTEFTKLEIPFDKVASLTMDAKTATAVLVLQNGDKFSGKVQLKTLDLETIIGKVSIPIEQVVRLTIPGAAAAPAQVDAAKVAATRNACLNNLRQIESAKDQWALDHNNAAPAALADLVGPNAYIRNMPVCGAGGKYILNGLGVNPTCTVHKQLLPDI
ncbi:MAG: hypothetical protein NTV49_09125 [Kiritimatiellaeota bacterium]|nr:hypothetical protein [Kiritimatiellota bacterium]